MVVHHVQQNVFLVELVIVLAVVLVVVLVISSKTPPAARHISQSHSVRSSVFNVDYSNTVIYII